MKIVVLGQALIHHAVAWREDLLTLTERADAVICNFEGCVRPIGTWPMKRKTVHSVAPSAISALSELGVTQVSIANNHVWDFGHAGILATRSAIEHAGIGAAGAGISLEEAAAPAIRNGVALLAVDAGPTPDWAVAGAGPGVNALRVSRSLGLPSRSLDQLKEISRISGDKERRSKRVAIGYEAPGTSDEFYGIPIEPAESPTEMWRTDEADVARLVSAIHLARKAADHVIVSIHYHHWALDWSSTPDWLALLGRTILREGADGIVATGPPVCQTVALTEQDTKVFAPCLGNLVFHTRRGARYDMLGIPVWTGAAVVFENHKWSACHIAVQT